MAKIPFSIDYRPQIESGEYKVETRDGRDARIICWDSKAKDARHDTRPIIALVTTPIPGLESLIQCGENGILYKDAKDRNDLFIVTPEPDLTEFERGIKRGFLCAGLEDVPTGIIKDTAKELLEIAKKELCKGCTRCTEEYWRGRKEAMEEVSKGFHYEGPAIPTYFPSCYHGGPCTNPMHDCINCPRQSTGGINTTTGKSSGKLSGNVESHE